MIIRVWGIVNSTEVEFTPIPDRPGYWEGTAPRVPGLQDIEIWAESGTGARGHLQCTVMIDYHAHTEVHLILLPYVAQLTMAWVVDTLPGAYQACLSGCRKAVS